MDQKIFRGYLTWSGLQVLICYQAVLREPLSYLICDTSDPRTVQQYLLRMDDFARVLSQNGPIVDAGYYSSSYFCDSCNW